MENFLDMDDMSNGGLSPLMSTDGWKFLTTSLDNHQVEYCSSLPQSAPVSPNSMFDSVGKLDAFPSKQLSAGPQILSPEPPSTGIDAEKWLLGAVDNVYNNKALLQEDAEEASYSDTVMMDTTDTAIVHHDHQYDAGKMKSNQDNDIAPVQSAARPIIVRLPQQRCSSLDETSPHEKSEASEKAKLPVDDEAKLVDRRKRNNGACVKARAKKRAYVANLEAENEKLKKANQSLLAFIQEKCPEEYASINSEVQNIMESPQQLKNAGILSEVCAINPTHVHSSTDSGHDGGACIASLLNGIGQLKNIDNRDLVVVTGNLVYVSSLPPELDSARIKHQADSPVSPNVGCVPKMSKRGRPPKIKAPNEPPLTVAQPVVAKQRGRPRKIVRTDISCISQSGEIGNGQQ